MATGVREDEQSSLWVATSELPTSPGHPFYTRLNTLLDAHTFDRFVEGLCRKSYAKVLGRPSLQPGRYFRLLLLGYFEGLDSERGIAWRASDSLTVRAFLRLPLDEAPPDQTAVQKINAEYPEAEILMVTHSTNEICVRRRKRQAHTGKDKTKVADRQHRRTTMKTTTLIRDNGNGQRTDTFMNPGQKTYGGTFLGLMLAVLFVLVNAGAVNAATYTVMNSNNSGAGSLRQAIIDANSTVDDDIIAFAPSLSGQTITLAGGTLVINSPLTINGLGADYLTIAGNGQSTVIDVFARVTISGITITQGNGVFGGAISNNNNLTVSNSTFRDNIGGIGGGISSNGNLTVSNSTFSNNTATGFGGGGIAASGGLTVSDSTFSNNTAATGFGGGVYIGVLFTGSQLITNSVFSGNSAGAGGGIYSEVNPELTIINSTVSGNSGVTDGGGIYSVDTMLIINSTITGNSAGFAGGLFSEAAFDLGNTIVAGNTGAYGCPDVGVYGLLFSQGYNLIGNVGDSDCLVGTPAAGDQFGTSAAPINALLGPLQDNGGATFTHALLPASPAIDAGSNALAVDSSNNPLLTDQRGTGFSRIVNSIADIGAFEVQPVTAQYNFTGFFAPVENLPMVNQAKAVTSIPVKFSLNGNQGLAIFAVGYPASSPVVCDASEPSSTVTETVTAGNSSLSYDAASDLYQYVWKTDKAWKGTCRILVVKFIDGSEHYAKFSFK